MRRIALLLIIGTALSGCARRSTVQPQTCPTLPPLPASVMQPQNVDFNKEMSSFLFSSPNEPKPSGSN